MKGVLVVRLTFGHSPGNCFPLYPLFVLNYANCFLAPATRCLRTPGTAMQIPSSTLSARANLKPFLFVQNPKNEATRARLIYTYKRTQRHKIPRCALFAPTRIIKQEFL